MASCDFCAYNEYDEEDEAYYCSVNMDEDDMARFVQSNYKECPFYRSGDEYKVYGTRCNLVPFSLNTNYIMFLPTHPWISFHAFSPRDTTARRQPEVQYRQKPFPQCQNQHYMQNCLLLSLHSV